MKQQSLKRCPIGIQTFEEIINKDYLYIDTLVSLKKCKTSQYGSL